MNKVLVLGCCGSGKSTFSRQLAHITGLPIIHLDQHYFKPGWEEPDKATWRDKVHQLCHQERWIMDGNYSGTIDIRLEHADTVIYLDNPTYSNLYRVCKRIMTYRGIVRPDAAPGCAERWDLDFLHYVLVFNWVRRPGLLKKLRSGVRDFTLSILKGDKERQSYLVKCRQTLS